MTFLVELLDLDFGLASLAGDQRRDVSAVAESLIGMTIVALAGEIDKTIRPAAGEIPALLEARVDDRDADLVAVVPALRQSESVDEHVFELGRRRFLLLSAPA